MRAKRTWRPLYWLLPLAFALPLLGAAGYAALRLWPKAQPLVDIALKMVVIP